MIGASRIEMPSDVPIEAELRRALTAADAVLLAQRQDGLGDSHGGSWEATEHRQGVQLSPDRDREVIPWARAAAFPDARDKANRGPASRALALKPQMAPGSQ